MKQPLTLAEIELARNTAGRSALLFITDRCPVGCGHCSVDSRADSPMIEDWELFHAVVEALATQPGLDVVGVSGGEPFVERRGLCEAVERLTRAGRRVVLYTSAIWALSKVPAWIPPVLQRASAVFLSTDAFHAAAVSYEGLRQAAEVILDQGCQLIVQVLDDPESLARMEALKLDLGQTRDPARAEVNVIRPLPYGRAAGLHSWGLRLRGIGEFGRCGALASPVVRYDGRVIACCNEQVIMGRGPDSLRRRGTTANELRECMTNLARDPALRLVQHAGLGGVVLHPKLRPMRDRKCRTICEACWSLQDQIPDRSDRLLQLMAEVVP